MKLYFYLGFIIKDMGCCQSQHKYEKLRLQILQERAETMKNNLAFIHVQKNAFKLNSRQEQLLNCSVVQLIELLNNGSTTSRKLLLLFAQRALTLGVSMNLITEPNFSQAWQLAEQCDKFRTNSRKRNWRFGDPWDMKAFLPPLYGLPISIKDTFDIAGLSSSIGITNRAAIKMQADGTLIKAIKRSGLIPFCKSNVPQLAMIFESNNFVWGRAENPWDTTRAVGGSSGGEGALIAAKCSPLGVGSDIGGSLRIPAQFCGVFSLKPSSSTLSNNYQTVYSNSFSGMDTLNVCIGPMSMSVDALALWMKVVTSQEFFSQDYDPSNRMIPFNDQIYQQYQSKPRLRIGFVQNLRMIECSPASLRALQETKKILRAEGHELVEMEIPQEELIIRSFFAELAAEGNCITYREMMEGQDIIPEYQTAISVSELGLLHGLVSKIVSWKSQRLGFILKGSAKKSVNQYFNHVGQVKKQRQSWFKYWKEKKVEFLVMPGFGCQACLHGFSNDLTLAAAYTFIWNVLDMTVGAMPITLCRKEEEEYNSKHQDQVTEKMRKTAQGSAGLPVGVQLVALPFSEQKILGLMKRIENTNQFAKKHSFPISVRNM